MFHKLLFILLPISCLFMFQNSNQLNTVIQEVEEAEQTAKSVGVLLVYVSNEIKGNRNVGIRSCIFY